MGWLGHVGRLDETRKGKRYFVGETQVIIKFGRLRVR
jgi:hypothetical protein